MTLHWPSRHPAAHPDIPDPRRHESWSVRLSDRVAGAFGTMTMFWVLVCWQLGWMTAATLGAPLLRADPYPFVFCLFLSNLIQLWALPILGTATNRADQKRAAKAEADHAAQVHIAHATDATHHLVTRIATALGVHPDQEDR